jgi:type II secretory pathway pseudopilin PulG
MRIFPYLNPFNAGRCFTRYVVRYSSIDWLELLICTTIVAILMATAATIYREQILTARVSQAVLGLPMADIKNDMMVYHAHTGQWPGSFDDIRKWPVFPHYAYQSDLCSKSVTIEDGAIDIVLNAPFQERTVTVRPAVPNDDPLGPVAWYVGRPLNASDKSLAGQDKTDIPLNYIHPRLR